MCNEAVRQGNAARAVIKSLEECAEVGMFERKNERNEFLTRRGEFSDQLAIRITKRDAGRHKLY